VIDEEPGFRAVVRRMLLQRGFEPTVVPGAAEAFAAMARRDYAVALIDARLDGQAGHEVLAEMRRRGLELPVVGMSGSPPSDRDRRRLHAASSDFLDKPFNTSRLVEALDKALRRPEAGAPTRCASSAPGRFPVTALVGAVRDGRLRLPAIAPIASDVQRLLSTPECGVQEVLDVVCEDPVLVTAILRRAQSADLAGSRLPLNLRSACLRLGNRRVLSIAQEVLVSGLFELQVEPWASVARAMWRNAVLTARTARALATALGHTDPEGTYVAGLVHNLGEIALLQLLAQGRQGAERVDLDFCAREVARQHEEVGAILLRGWGFPPRLAHLAGTHHRGSFGGIHRSSSSSELVVLAWAMTLRAGHGYLPGLGAPDVGLLGEAVGVDPDEVDAMVAALSDPTDLFAPDRGSGWPRPSGCAAS